MATIQEISYNNVQSDWEVVLREGVGKFWVSSYHESKDLSEHVDCFVEKSVPEGIVYDSKKNMTLNLIDNYHMQVECKTTGAKSICIAPIARFTELHKKSAQEIDHPYFTRMPTLNQITTIDVDGTLGVSGSERGSFKLWNSNNGTEMKNLEGHIGDATTARFFPSSNAAVVLTAAMDCLMKVWATDNGLCALTLGGNKNSHYHTKPIRHTLFQNEGKQVYSASEDGQILLWDLSKGTSVSAYSPGKQGLNAIYGMCNLNLNIEGKIDSIVAAMEDRMLHIIDTRTMETTIKTGVITHERISSIDTHNNHPNLVLTGASNGLIQLYDIRKPTMPLLRCRKTDGEIKKLKFTSNVSEKASYGFWSASQEGEASLWEVDSDFNCKVVAELSGSDINPIYDMCLNEMDTKMYVSSVQICKYQNLNTKI